MVIILRLSNRWLLYTPLRSIELLKDYIVETLFFYIISLIFIFLAKFFVLIIAMKKIVIDSSTFPLSIFYIFVTES